MLCPECGIVVGPGPMREGPNACRDGKAGGPVRFKNMAARAVAALRNLIGHARRVLAGLHGVGTYVAGNIDPTPAPGK